MKLLNMFKRKSQQTLQTGCANLSASNDCTLVSEIKRLQSELENTENAIESLKSGKFDGVCFCEIFKFIENDNLYRYARASLYDCYNNIDKAEMFSNVLKCIDLNEFIKEITFLYDRSKMIHDKENEAAELREKITEAKNALGIK